MTDTFQIIAGLVLASFILLFFMFGKRINAFKEEVKRSLRQTLRTNVLKMEITNSVPPSFFVQTVAFIDSYLAPDSMHEEDEDSQDDSQEETETQD